MYLLDRFPQAFPSSRNLIVAATLLGKKCFTYVRVRLHCTSASLRPYAHRLVIILTLLAFKKYKNVHKHLDVSILQALFIV